VNQYDLFGVGQPHHSRNRLEEFCDRIAHHYSGKPQVAPEELAQDFSTSFRINLPITLDDQLVLAKRLGIRQVRFVPLSDEVGGLNARVGDVYAIRINELNHRVRQEHTLFHEVFELIQHRLEEVMHSYRRYSKLDLERAADEFASNVFMPSESFLKDAFEKGLDVIELQTKYKRAYSSILIRTARTLQKSGIPFVGLLYEDVDYENVREAKRRMKDPIESRIPLEMSLRYRWTTLALSPRQNPVLASYLPTKGDMVIPGTLARLAFEHRGPVLIERATGFDFFGMDDLTMLIRPVIWDRSAIAKVIITAVRYEQRRLLQPQLSKIEFNMVDRMHGLHSITSRPPVQLSFLLDPHPVSSSAQEDSHPAV